MHGDRGSADVVHIRACDLQHGRDLVVLSKSRHGPESIPRLAAILYAVCSRPLHIYNACMEGCTCMVLTALAMYASRLLHANRLALPSVVQKRRCILLLRCNSELECIVVPRSRFAIRVAVSSAFGQSKSGLPLLRMCTHLSLISRHPSALRPLSFDWLPSTE